MAKSNSQSNQARHAGSAPVNPVPNPSGKGSQHTGAAPCKLRAGLFHIDCCSIALVANRAPWLHPSVLDPAPRATLRPRLGPQPWRGLTLVWLPQRKA